jgi:hypothetical protein
LPKRPVGASTTATRGGDRTMAAVWQRATVGPVAGDLSVVKELFGRDEPGIWVNRFVALARAQGIESVFGGFGSRPGYRASHLCRAVFAGVSRNQKSRSPVEAALRRSRTCKSPGYTAESSSRGGNSQAITWPDAPCDVTRAATRPRWPSMDRWSRFHVASSYRMKRSIWMGTRFVNTDQRLFNYLAMETRQ